MILLYQHDQAQSKRIQHNIQQIGQQWQSLDSLEALSSTCLHHQLVIIDLEVPGQCGFDICHQLRTLYPQMSLVAVTTASSETDQILALELGADDVITLPCHDRAFQARIKVQLRRAAPASSLCFSRLIPTDGVTTADNASALQCGLLQLNIKGHTASVNGEKLALTATEFALLKHFVENPNQVFTRRRLMWDTTVCS